jgi:predicted DNA-binding protein
MSEKNYDRKGRWRSKTVAFRMSPEENNELNIRVKFSGLTKQDYLVNKALEKEIVVQGNPKVYIALKRQLEEVLQELKALQGETPSEELLDTICLINRTLYGMKGENKNDCP